MLMENIAILIVLNFLTIWMDVSHLYPLPQTGTDQELGGNFDDARNKLPDVNVVGKANDMKVQEDGLSSDEQEECYRQQNIDPPANLKKGRSVRKTHNLEGVLAVAPNLSKYLKHSKASEKSPLVKTAKSHNLKKPRSALKDMKDEYLPKKFSGVGSLPRSNKNKRQETDPNMEKGQPFEKQDVEPQFFEENVPPPFQGKRSTNNVNHREYKPTGHFEVGFPVYDEDIDFKPDPLHGILDDKYWENQEDRAAVIKSYMDLAATSMVGYGEDVVKRNAEKCEFDERGERCNCNQIAACKDCKKGRQEEASEKQNNTTTVKNTPNKVKRSHYLDGISDVNSPNRIHNSVNIMATGGEEVYDHLPESVNFLSRKLLSWEDENDDKGDVDVDGDYPDEFDDNRFPQNLTTASYNHEKGEYINKYDNINESYNSAVDRSKTYIEDNEDAEVADDIVESVGKGSEKSSNEMSTRIHNENSYDISTKSSTNTNIIKSSSTDRKNLTFLHEPYLEFQTENPVNNGGIQNANIMKKNVLLDEREDQVQAKTSKPVLDEELDEEFEAVDNKILSNLTLSPSSLQNLTKRQTYNSKGNFLNKKGRRNPQEVEPDINKFLAEANLHQNGNTLDTSTPSVDKSTELLSNFDRALNTTKQATRPKTIKRKVNRRKVYTEENEDAEVANDIVKSVLKESQKPSNIIHNLGLYHRNESLKNVKYGKIVPETELIVKDMLDCIMNKMKNILAMQSCILLDPELLEFLKWLVLTGESYRDYSRHRFTNKLKPDSLDAEFFNVGIDKDDSSVLRKHSASDCTITSVPVTDMIVETTT